MGNCFGSSSSIPATPPTRNKTQPQNRTILEKKKPSPVAVAPTSSSPASREVLLQAAEKRLKEQQSRGIPSGGKTQRDTSSLRDSDGPDIKDWLN
ncbi:hypothetical protein GpartN1_g6538.t1 [Galdieria partita]|uniref:Uncharacterized protein n=1 Tax=Galdieria partita TaxID=83374 RepID=A0A9C7Q381_9RHOD|nr:hypothetical protein GpartN1_g6538.t1 [Galdieria partita]